MTFNKYNNKTYDFNENLINSEDKSVSNIIDNLNSLAFEFEQKYSDVKEYHKKLNSLSEKEFSRLKVIVHNQIEVLPSIIQEINSKMNILENRSFNEDYNTKSRVTETMKSINNKIRPKQSELSKLINEITQKERARKDFNSSMTEQEMDRFQSLDKQDHSELQFSIKDVQLNDQIMKAREAELLHVQKVSAQIKEMTQYMNQNVNEQGKMLSK
jgi:hypothetical protein